MTRKTLSILNLYITQFNYKGKIYHPLEFLSSIFLSQLIIFYKKLVLSKISRQSQGDEHGSFLALISRGVRPFTKGVNTVFV